MAQPRVFLSYSTKDAAFTDRLEADLKAAGVDVYRISASDGGDFVKRINDALATCEYVVLVLTRDALASPWVESEMNAAIRLARQGSIKSILPIQTGPVHLRDITPLWGVYNIFDAAGDYAAARDALIRALGVAGESAADLIEHGKALQERGKLAEALPLFERAAQLDPHSFDAWFNLGTTLYYTNGPDVERLAAYDQALALKPTDALAWNNKGNALYNLNRLEEALAAYESSTVFAPNFANARTNKGWTLNDLGRFDEALLSLTRALALDSDASDAWTQQAVALRGLGRITEAEEAERRAQELGG